MSEQLAYSVDDFCRLHGICRVMLYKLWKQGLGPRYMMLGNRRRITAEAAAVWRREREAATAMEAA